MKKTATLLFTGAAMLALSLFTSSCSSTNQPASADTPSGAVCGPGG